MNKWVLIKNNKNGFIIINPYKNIIMNFSEFYNNSKLTKLDYNIYDNMKLLINDTINFKLVNNSPQSGITIKRITELQYDELDLEVDIDISEYNETVVNKEFIVVGLYVDEFVILNEIIEDANRNLEEDN